MDEAKGKQTVWEGRTTRRCGEHRSTGQRAWCFDCNEWCYPCDDESIDAAGYCKGCQIPALEATVSSLRDAQPVLWECPDCGFSFDAIHTAIKDGVDTGEHYCPACAELRLEAENSSLREERDEARRERDFAHDKGYQEGYTGGYLDGRQNLDDVKGQLAAKTEEAAQNAAKAALADRARYFDWFGEVSAGQWMKWLHEYDALLAPSAEQSQP